MPAPASPAGPGARSGRHDFAPVAVLVAVTAVWGLTFVIVKEAIAAYPPTAFLAVRFLLAAVLLGAFAARHPGDAPLGLLIGTLLAAGYATQTFGLRVVPPSIAGLLTGLFVVFTPLCDAVLFRVRTPRVTWAALGVALVGMGLVTWGGSFAPGALAGEGLLLLCAVAFAAHISYLSRHSQHHSPLALAAWQMMACAVVFLAGAGVSHQLTLPPPQVIGALLLTGVLASALAFLAQTWAQRHMGASRAALVLTAEPAFAVLFGVALAGDALTAPRVAGAALVLAALAGHEAIAARGRPVGEPAI